MAALGIIGVALIVLAPAKSVERASAAVVSAPSLENPDIPILKAGQSGVREGAIGLSSCAWVVIDLSLVSDLPFPACVSMQSRI